MRRRKRRKLEWWAKWFLHVNRMAPILAYSAAVLQGIAGVLLLKVKWYLPRQPVVTQIVSQYPTLDDELEFLVLFV
ncbi:hypothetical protein EMPS_02557 [Entomortierella parvispora]|uniref:Uncharacterized protein n=1 Tax=Entomortierella parvispora TaxID=205924 RepID=A0A9P3LTP0_9FUNG|nr:hypothetical protein EMPS_02557 [Entomortierella parvispora]